MSDQQPPQDPQQPNQQPVPPPGPPAQPYGQSYGSGQQPPQPPPPQPQMPQGSYGYTPAYGAVAAQQMPQTNNNAIVAFVLAIVSWALCPIVCAIIALVFASKAKKEIASSNGWQTGSGFVTAAIWIAWVNIIFMTLAFIVYIIFIIFIIAAGSTSGNYSTYSTLIAPFLG